ncbi:MAG: class I SAM-dependent methyltransferase [Gemmatimonadota bacterium]
MSDTHVGGGQERLGDGQERLLEYARELFARESEVHEWIRAQIEARGFPPIHVSPLEGRILALLAGLVGASRLLEIGTLGGYSALWLVSLLSEDARLISIENDPHHAELAREAIRRAGEEERIELRVGDAREILGHEILPDPASWGAFDLVFIDADKEGYPYYLEAAADLLRPGGLLLGDNAFWEGKVVDDSARDPETEAIREFNRRLSEDRRFRGVILPVRDGLAAAMFVGR